MNSEKKTQTFPTIKRGVKFQLWRNPKPAEKKNKKHQSNKTKYTYTFITSTVLLKVEEILTTRERSKYSKVSTSLRKMCQIRVATSALVAAAFVASNSQALPRSTTGHVCGYCDRRDHHCCNWEMSDALSVTRSRRHSWTTRLTSRTSGESDGAASTVECVVVILVVVTVAAAADRRNMNRAPEGANKVAAISRRDTSNGGRWEKRD